MTARLLHLLALVALLPSCTNQDAQDISEDQARAVLADKYFVIEKTPVEYNYDDGLWYDSRSGELADGAAWVPDTGGNVDDYLVNPDERPEEKERPERVGYIRNFYEGRQQGATISLTAAGIPNKIFYYHDNSMEWRFRFNNREKFTITEIIELTDGHADGRLWRFHPNLQPNVEGAMWTIWDENHPKGGPDYRAGRWQEWAPDGELLMDVDFDPNNGSMSTLRTMAEGFRLYWNYRKDADGNPTDEHSHLEVMLKGVNGGYPIVSGSQAEEWLLAHAPEQPVPAIPLTEEGRKAIRVEGPDLHQAMDSLRLEEVPQSGPPLELAPVEEAPVSPEPAPEAEVIPAVEPVPEA